MRQGYTTEAENVRGDKTGDARVLQYRQEFVCRFGEDV